MNTQRVWIAGPIILASALLLSAGVALADENQAEEGPPPEPMNSMVLGEITAIEGDHYTVLDGDGNMVRFKALEGTGTAFKVGDQIIVSLSPSGQVDVVTAARTEGPSTPETEFDRRDLGSLD